MHGASAPANCIYSNIPQVPASFRSRFFAISPDVCPPDKSKNPRDSAFPTPRHKKTLKRFRRRMHYSSHALRIRALGTPRRLE
jgi:hypothetical protein